MKGLQFESRVGKELEREKEIFAPESTSYPHQWFWFRDRHGDGRAQPDFFFVNSDYIWLFEVKLSQCREGWRQIENLYKPLLEFHFGLKVFGVQVCRYLKEKDSGLVTGWDWDKIKNGSTVHLII